MRNEEILMRDLCDTIMQNHAVIQEEKQSTEKAIADFRHGLTKEQRAQFNCILDRVNVEDSKYAYDAFQQGVVFATIISEYR